MANNITDYSVHLLTPVIVFHFSTAITATLLNLLIIVTIYQTTVLHSPSRILLCSLAISDFLIGSIAQPVAALYYISAINRWLDAYCILWVLMTNFGYAIGVMSISILTAMSVDRCLAVTTMTNYKNYVTKRRTLVVCLVMWLTVFTVNIITIHMFSHTVKYALVSTFVAILMGTIIVSFSLSFHTLKRISRAINDNGQSQIEGTSSSPQSFNITKYRHSLRTMAIILSCNLVVYIPPLILISSKAVINQIPNQFVYMQYFGFIITLNSTLNPLLYIWRMRDLRRAVKEKRKTLTSYFTMCIY